MFTSDQEAIDLIMRRLGRRTDPDLRADVLMEMNLAKQSLEVNPFVPWFLFTTVDLNVPLGAFRIDLPAGFLLEDEEAEALIYDAEVGAEYKIHKRRREDIDILGLEPKVEGRPIRYTLSDTGIYFYPKTDKQYTFRLPCAISTASVEDSGESLNPWLVSAPNLLIGLAGAQVAEFHTQNEKLAQKFLSMAAAARQTLINYHEARHVINVDSSSSDLIADREDRP